MSDRVNSFHWEKYFLRDQVFDQKKFFLFLFLIKYSLAAKG